jgi:hypothetical protein
MVAKDIICCLLSKDYFFFIAFSNQLAFFFGLALLLALAGAFFHSGCLSFISRTLTVGTSTSTKPAVKKYFGSLSD